MKTNRVQVISTDLVVNNYETLNQLLLNTLQGIKNKTIALDEAKALSQVADKIIKNNMTMILDAKRTNDQNPISFFNSNYSKKLELKER